jgi:decaprenylphospho-beta-D-erythro-pentofuranosid-2-ulose 2-reductase
MKHILIIGANSSIATATARRWALAGHRFYLLGRTEATLQALAADLRVRGASQVGVGVFEANAIASHPALLDAAIAELEGLDLVLIAHGSLPDQKRCERDFAYALGELNTNAISTLSLLTHLANRLESQRRGALVVLSSVAGDRGRGSNYLYGTAKAAVTVFLQGLRQRLAKSGVTVLTVKPGFVDTPMTAHLKKGPLWAAPETIARCIDQGLARGRHEIYAPGFWRLIMWVIRSIPSRVFSKLSL